MTKRLTSERPGTYCALSPIACYEPVDCGDCRFFEKNLAYCTIWLCPECAKNREGRAPRPFYHQGTCSNCGEFSPALAAYQ